MDKLTLDTNILRDWAWCEGWSQDIRYASSQKKKQELQGQFQTIKQLRDTGVCELGVSNILFVDFDADGRDELPEFIDKMIGPFVKIATPSITVFPWVFPAILADRKEIEEIFATAFPVCKPEHKKFASNKKDALQLYAHKAAGRDYFITSDRLWRRRQELWQKHRIKVCLLGDYMKLHYQF